MEIYSQLFNVFLKCHICSYKWILNVATQHRILPASFTGDNVYLFKCWFFLKPRKEKKQAWFICTLLSFLHNIWLGNLKNKFIDQIYNIHWFFQKVYKTD